VEKTHNGDKYGSERFDYDLMIAKLLW
jgi:hypothetical protein